MIQGINNPYEALGRLENRSNEVKGTSDSAFTGALNAAKELLEATNQAEEVTTQLTYDFMTGKSENVHNIMIAQEKSSILLQFTMQVRNNVLQAYQEIMRIPV